MELFDIVCTAGIVAETCDVVLWGLLHKNDMKTLVVEEQSA